MWETWVQSLGQEDSLEKEMATHSGTLAQKIPWTEEPGRLQSMALQTVRHNWATSLSFLYLFTADLQLPKTLRSPCINKLRRENKAKRKKQFWACGHNHWPLIIALVFLAAWGKRETRRAAWPLNQIQQLKEANRLFYGILFLNINS